QISQFEFEKNKANEEIESSQKDIQELADKSNSLFVQASGLEKEINVLLEKKYSVDENISKHENELSDFENGFNQFVNLQNERKLELERLKGQIENIHNAIKRTESNQLSITNGIEKRKTDLQANEVETNSLQEIIDQSNLSLVQINTLRTTLLTEEKEINDKLKVVKDEAAQFENQLNALRNERQTVSDQVHSFEMKENEFKLRTENLIEHIKENYSIELALKQFDDLDTFDFEGTTNEVQTLKGKIRNIGPVNLLAYSEYEEEKKRLDFLHKQRDDLVNSEKDLIKTINEINETAQQLFMDTFEKIRQNFTTIFQTLFNPGDEADLYLEEGIDPLEGKIEIMAKPKGK
ncbi:MAG: chromosome segregation protein SMC, partial [Bacteroidota bacterium]